MFKLVDDGTLDTVVQCVECRAQLRYNMDEAHAEDCIGVLGDCACYARFIEWALADAEASHCCPGPPPTS